MVRPILLLAFAAFFLAPSAAASTNGAFSIEMAMDEKWTKPQTVVAFPVTFTNHQAGPLALTFTLVRVEGGILAPTPRPVTLEPGASATVPFAAQAPYENGRMDETGTATFRAATSGAEEEFTFTVHTKGFYLPGPQAFGALAALGLAALAFGRRRAGARR